MPSMRYLINGRVQRVGFRESTRAEATRLGLQGHARNLADGRVEVLAVGPEEALKAFERWLQQGPAPARVDSVEAEPAADGVGEGFSVR